MKIYFFSNLFLLLALLPVTDCFGQKGKDLSLAAVSIENPPGFGGSLGTVGIGVVGENRTRGARKTRSDGNAAVYLGLGNPYKYIGISASVNISGLSNTHGSTGNLGEGSLDIAINKLVSKVFFLKLGTWNLTNWARKQSVVFQRSYFGSGTFFLSFDRREFGQSLSYIAFTVGAGNGIFRKDKDLTINNSGHFNPFISIAVPILRKNNIIVEWTGYDISTGISSNNLFFKRFPVLFNLEATDYVRQPMRFAGSISFFFNYLKTY